MADANAFVTGQTVLAGPTEALVDVQIVATDGSAIVSLHEIVTLPTSPAQWRQAIIDGIVSMSAPLGFTVLQVIFPDFQP